MSADPALATRLADWLATRIEGASDLHIGGLGRLESGHSAEMLRVAIAWNAGGSADHLDAVIRLCPPSPGLLEPYDLERQYRILEGLTDTAVRAPRALYLDATGDVLGRPSFVMERMPGEVFEERAMPTVLVDDPERCRALARSFVLELVAIHQVDLEATGLCNLGDGATFLDRELDRWSGEIARVARGPLPGIQRLEATLREAKPEPTPRITLVHGDAKPGNFAFVGTEVSGVFDWEMTDIGDPMADVGYTESLWMAPGFTSHPGGLTRDEFVSLWETKTGLVAHDREWYRALAYYKLAAIMLLGGWLFNAGHSDDLRMAGLAGAFPMMTNAGLAELGLEPPGDHGPYQVDADRLARVNVKRS